ncbi:hypothetical protein ACE41H_21580 [Paenibacillus enshidis]|uniref:Protein kinase domain-containing protein n=1 Tax=Paenibacillus enshidis TaxID=1458439 RepID=A0ABV5AYR9_9BACL
MKTTEFIKNLPSDLRSVLETGDRNLFFNKISLDPMPIRANRAWLFEIAEYDLVFKRFTPKGKRDYDIDALKDLQGIAYFPVLYAYEEQEFLIMQKVPGQDIESLMENGMLSEEELEKIREQYKKAMRLAIERKRYDWDMKLEHLFWDKETQRLMLIDFGEYDVFRGTDVNQALEGLLEHFDEEIDMAKEW